MDSQDRRMQFRYRRERTPAWLKDGGSLPVLRGVVCGRCRRGCVRAPRVRWEYA